MMVINWHLYGQQSLFVKVLMIKGQQKGRKENNESRKICWEQKASAYFYEWRNRFTVESGMLLAGSVPAKPPPAPPPLAALVTTATPLELLCVPNYDRPVLLHPSSSFHNRLMLPSATVSCRCTALDSAHEVGGQLMIADFAGVDRIRTPGCHQQLPLFFG